VKTLADTMLVGLSRAGAAASEPNDADQDLVARMGELAAERAFLLRLGVQAVRLRAGFAAASVTARPDLADAETRPPCSPALAALVADLCASGSKVILAEALARMDARGARLPPQALPALAELRETSLLPAATHVAGERGRWLARHNPAWRWLVDGVAPASLAERRRTWDEGTPEARLSTLRATRVTEPAEARAWIEATWKAEKASLREEIIAALAAGLSADDEPLLTQALADRAAGVRAAAASLLARLETSPLAARARARAEALLGYEPPKAGVLESLKARIAGPDPGTLSVSPPKKFDRAWAEDGIVEKPPAGTGERAFWSRQILAMVSPAHWERRFGATAESLARAAEKTEWADAVLAAWTDATARFEARGWAATLWTVRAPGEKPEALSELAASLFPLMDASVVHEAAAERLGGASPHAWNGVLAAVPRPWSPALAEAFTRALSRALANAQLDWAAAAAWRATLELAAPALPAAAFDALLALDVPETGAAALRNPFDSFRAVLTLRKRIDQETRS
jgi:hypothetical protein